MGRISPRRYVRPFRDIAGAAGGEFRTVELHPAVTISAGDPEVANNLHDAANRVCYIGRSVKTEVRIIGTVTVAGAAAPA